MKTTMSRARTIMETNGVNTVETVRTHGGLRFNIVATYNKLGQIDSRGRIRRPRTLRVNAEDLVR